jgi:type VI secretion system ImpJ/VasE family protein
MAKIEQVHWHEGLFLQPHHLQALQRQGLDRLALERRLAYPYPYGVVEQRLSSDALENMLVQFDRLLAVMPSGLVVDVPHNTDLDPLDIKAVFESASAPITISLGVPLWYADRANAIERGESADPRVKRLYRVRAEEWNDENTGDNPQPMLVRRINARLMLEDDDHTSMETLPVVTISHATGEDVGLPRQDSHFVPPCFLMTGSPVLRELVRDLANAVEASRAELVVQINRGGAFNFETVRGIQIEQVMRLTALNRFSGRLRQLVQAPSVTPFDMYLELRDLLGSLAALWPENDQYEVPDYDHDDPAVCFEELCAKVRRLLRGAVLTPILRVPFRREGHLLTAALTDEHLTKPNEYFLGVKSKQDPQAVAQLVGNRDEFKLMPRSLADRAVFGVLLVEERYPPIGLPAETGLQHFRLQRAESQRMWDRIVKEKAMAIRFPGIETTDFSITLYMTVPEMEG